jgi:hypothetical protein
VSSLKRPAAAKPCVGRLEEVAVLPEGATVLHDRWLPDGRKISFEPGRRSSADNRSDSRTSLASTVILHSTTSFLTELPTSVACQINRRAGLIPAVQRPHGTGDILASARKQARGVWPFVKSSFQRRSGQGWRAWTAKQGKDAVAPLSGNRRGLTSGPPVGLACSRCWRDVSMARVRVRWRHPTTDSPHAVS